MFGSSKTKKLLTLTSVLLASHVATYFAGYSSGAKQNVYSEQAPIVKKAINEVQVSIETQFKDVQRLVADKKFDEARVIFSRIQEQSESLKTTSPKYAEMSLKLKYFDNALKLFSQYENSRAGVVKSYDFFFEKVKNNEKFAFQVPTVIDNSFNSVSSETASTMHALTSNVIALRIDTHDEELCRAITTCSIEMIDDIIAELTYQAQKYNSVAQAFTNYKLYSERLRTTINDLDEQKKLLQKTIRS